MYPYGNTHSLRKFPIFLSGLTDLLKLSLHVLLRCVEGWVFFAVTMSPDQFEMRRSSTLIVEWSCGLWSKFRTAVSHMCVGYDRRYFGKRDDFLLTSSLT